MKTNMKKFVLVSFAVIALVLSFTPDAEAKSIVSISFSNGHSGYSHNYDRWERKAHHKSRRAHKRAYKKAMHRAHRRTSRHVYSSFVAAHTPSVIYRPVLYPAPVLYRHDYVQRVSSPIYTQPTPMLANQASPSYSRAGQTCREYQSNVVIDGRTQPSYGTACLQKDGAWRIVD